MCIYIYICVCVCSHLPGCLFVTASHQTGLDRRSMTWRSIIVGIEAWAKTWILLDYAGYHCPLEDGLTEAGNLSSPNLFDFQSLAPQCTLHFLLDLAFIHISLNHSIISSSHHLGDLQSGHFQYHSTTAWFCFVLWHISHCRLFNAKSFLYMHIEYMTSQHIFLDNILNDPEFIAFANS